MENKKNNVAMSGVLLALAILVSYVELLIPIPFPVVGMKLGIANVIMVFVMYTMGVKEAYVISGVRVILVGILFGNVFSMIYAFAGAVASLTSMSVIKKYVNSSMILISIIGAICHSIGQVIIACILLESTIVLTYLPMLILMSIATGAIIGLLTREVMKRIWR